MNYHQMQQAQQAQTLPPYQTFTIDTSCCSGTIPHTRIAEVSNRMAESGYKLLQVYIDARPQCGPCCPIRCAVLIFRRHDIV